jgi:4-hydroxybenzoate polyprenyltransferase
MSDPASTARAPLRALLETLRAPLLLSPVADVLAGWTVAAVALSRAHPVVDWSIASDFDALALAAGAGCCLLAAGMAQNALVDLPEDRLVKPERPLPSGDIRPAAVATVCMVLTLGGVLLAAAISRPLLLLSGAIVLMTLAYHLGLKRHRVPGCIALGLLRGMDLMLGATAFLSISSDVPFVAPWDAPDIWQAPLLAAGLYALYITGASLHASTDDEPESGRASRVGLALAGIALLLAAATPATAAFAGTVGHVGVWIASAVVALLAILRLRNAARSLPPPAVTGVALSGLFLFDATVCLGSARWPDAVFAAVLILVLFRLSRLALRVFPPT